MKRKSMVLGVLLLAVMVTSYSVCGTYAKYVSSIDYTDEARVARWDFNIQETSTVDLFQSSYTTTDDNGTYTYVASKDAAKVVAPGTKGEYTYVLSGTAETNFKVSSTTTLVNNVAIIDNSARPADWDYGMIQYNPLEFSFDGGNTWVKTTELVKDENGKIIGLTVSQKDLSKVYAANSNVNEGHSIMWQWPFEAKDAEITYNYNDNDDTVLGLRAVEDNDLKISATISTSVVQTEERAEAQANVSATFTNRVSSEMIEAYEGYGYSRSNVANVKFDGTNFTGEIKENKSATLAKLMGNAATGYYYPLVVTPNASEEVIVEFDNRAANNESNVKTWNIAAGASKEVIVGLKENCNVVLTIKKLDGTVIETRTLNLDGLTFTAFNHQLDIGDSANNN